MSLVYCRAQSTTPLVWSFELVSRRNRTSLGTEVLNDPVCHTHQVVLDCGTRIPVHAAVLATHSEYFSKLFEGGWMEGMPANTALNHETCASTGIGSDGDDCDAEDFVQAESTTTLAPPPHVGTVFMHGCKAAAFQQIVNIMYTGFISPLSLTSVVEDTGIDQSHSARTTSTGDHSLGTADTKPHGGGGGREDTVEDEDEDDTDAEEINVMELLHWADYLQAPCVRATLLECTYDNLTIDNVCQVWTLLESAGISVGDLQSVRDFFIQVRLVCGIVCCQLLCLDVFFALM